MNPSKSATVLDATTFLGTSNLVASERVNTDFDWKFKAGDLQADEDFDPADYHRGMLDLRHDWSIEGRCVENSPAGGRCGSLPTGP